MDTPGRPEPTDREKAHVKKLKKLIDAALDREKSRFVKFEKYRRAYEGKVNCDSDSEDGERVRSNMVYANIAAMMPQVYAKNPDISFSPKESVGEKEYKKVKQFARTGEMVVRTQLTDAHLKKRAKALVRSAMTTGIGWWKVAFQDEKRTDPLIQNRINDIQDNLDRIRTLSEKVKADGGATADSDAEAFELERQLAALQQEPEIQIGRGIVIDPVLSEDVIVLDRTIRSFDEYTRADRIAHRTWMSAEAYEDNFGYKPEKATLFAKLDGNDLTSGPGLGKDGNKEGFYCVFEIWDKSANTVFTLCHGEERYCRVPFVPTKVGKRWYPFFALGFNLVDGRFYPLSDVELLTKLADEYNRSRDDLVKHRNENVPVRVFKKGGNFTDEDAQRIQNRQSNDLIGVNGTPNRPIEEDITILANPAIDPTVYDTSPTRSDMEQIMGGGDAARGSIQNAKTATEAEIMAQGLRSRTEERQDSIEDTLADVTQYVFEICLCELSPEEVQRIAGMEALWPQMSREEAYAQVRIEIRAGTSGKPNKLQEQDRWIQLMPIVKEAMLNIVELRKTGEAAMADAVSELLRETMQRFDERIDVDAFIPPAQSDMPLEEMDEEQLRQALMQGQTVMQQMQQQIDEMTKAIETEQVKNENAIALENAKADAKLRTTPAPVQTAPVAQPIDVAAQVGPMIQDLATRLEGLAMLVQQMGVAQAPIAPPAPLPPLTINVDAGRGVVTKQISLAGPNGEYSGTVQETAA